MRRSLDAEVPAVGGIPREVVKTRDGPAVVEKWLRGAEAMALPPDTPEGRLLNLDPLRREPGLPTVM